MTDEVIKAAAITMLERAYVPYSHVPVGAALECKDGTVFTGGNVEGRRQFRRIVIAGKGVDFCVPCGICRQVMREFSPELEIICLNGDGEERRFTLPELLPHSFGPEHLRECEG